MTIRPSWMGHPRFVSRPLAGLPRIEHAGTITALGHPQTKAAH
jgi:hypothetical protein